MKKMKKWLSAILSVAMVAGMLGGFGLNAKAYVAADIVSDSGWSIDVDMEAIASLLDGATDTRVFDGNNYKYNSEIFNALVDIEGLDLDYILWEDSKVQICVDNEYLGIITDPQPIDEDSVIVLFIDFDTIDYPDKIFLEDTFLTKLESNVTILADACDCEQHAVYAAGYYSYAKLYFELGRLEDILNTTPEPDPSPDPTYIEWNTSDPNVTKLMWHGGRETYATITETKDSTEVKFTGIGWFAISDELNNKFLKSGKNLNVTYPYKGYTVSVKIPADKIASTGVKWYGAEYFASLYMEEGYVTVTDYLGREVDPQVIITKKN